jgi:hypothetical protein
MIFTNEEIELVRFILANYTDEELYDLFGDVLQEIKNKLAPLLKPIESDPSSPYVFNSNFPDLHD